MRYAFQFKINFTGGIVSPGYLLHLMDAVKEGGIDHVRFGLRQQLLIDATHKQHDKLLASLDKNKVVYELNKDEYPNMVSSYAGADIFLNDSWLREGTYKDIFDLFDYAPRLKLAITDNNQTFTPFFTSNINWIASANNHFWHLYIRFPQTDVLFQWPLLVYTNEIPRLSKEIENIIFQQKELFFGNSKADGQWVFNTITQKLKYISKPVEEALHLPAFNLPYYEGFTHYGNKTWLGIYRRDELFPVDFLKDIALTCLKTKTGQLYTTTWKSIIIKNIEKPDRKEWDFVLNKHRINVRHAANELAWQVEDTNEDGLYIKRMVTRELDKQDVRTFGLCFGVNTQPESSMFGSVIIQRRFSVIRNLVKALDKYDILYTDGFNPNSKEYITFRAGIHKEHISTYLVSISKQFYELENQRQKDASATYQLQQKSVENIVEKYVYQCCSCLTVYDETLGENENGIALGSAFEGLPDSYCCPLCESPKINFKQINQSILGLQAV
ncbi:rubredoxin [Parasediminibacterium sp. JCM 36343]|uniref:rubredoxin n=1 Tax=Parasediminibacterium sp. JCM 36343 TaxID=3374279 RepID=UPI003978E6EC